MSNAAKFKRLLEPMQLKKVRLRNRIIKPGQRLGFIDKKGYVTQQDLDFYEALAKGGVGLIIVDHAFVDPVGAKIRQASITEDKYIPSMAKLVNVIHKHGCPAFLQISHIGQDHNPKHSGVLQPVSPSAMTEDDIRRIFPGRKNIDVLPRALSTPEVEDLVVKFADAAERVQKAGFDGVEIHGAHAYLIACFLSPVWNKREDKYGSQNMDNQTRFAVEIIQAARERVGKDFPVGIRMNGGEYGLDIGTDAAEGQQIARRMEAAGADYIHVSVYGYAGYNRLITPEQVFFPEPPEPFAQELYKSKHGAGALTPLAAGIKKVVSVPIIAVGRLDPILGERLLRKGMADAIAMGRRLMADPELPKKLAEGRYEDIAPCTACITCNELNLRGDDVTCRINAALGKEGEYEIKPAKKRKKVIIVGGGPAGMEAARVAALRGHEVTLYEKERKLGGLLSLAALIRGIEVEDIPAITSYLSRQITKAGVKVRLGEKFTLSAIEEIKPDVVILATGGAHTHLEIPGINGRNVLTTEELHRRAKTFLNLFGPRLLGWLTKLWLPIGKKVVIIGGLIYGCEAAEFLVKRDRKVTIVEESAQLGTKIIEMHRPKLLAWLARKGTAMLPEVKYEEITDKGLTITDKNGQKKTIEADTILITIPPKPNDEFLRELEQKVPEVYQIGDCKEPRLIVDAVGDGSRIGHTI
ncbi:FAD-dependent oxidoreductase [Chloroflexota bacterium]